MSLTLRLFCVIGAALTFIMIVTKVRRSRLRTEDTVFWIVISLALLIVAIFPNIAYELSSLFGVQAPSNFVFLVTITILLIKEFYNTLVISQLKSKLNELVQENALSSAAPKNGIPSDGDSDCDARR